MKPTLHACPKRQMTTRLMLLALITLGLGQTRGFSQMIFQYTNASTGAANYVDPNANDLLPSLARGAGVTNANLGCTGATEGFGSTAWPVTNVFNVNMFNTDGDFISFTLDPDPGFGLQITGFSARSRRENLTGTADDGPLAIRYGYSIDGGASWVTVNPGNPQSSNLCASGGVNRVWPAWAQLNISVPIIFRIYGLSSGSSGKGDFFLRDVIVNGAVCASSPTIVLGSSPVECFSNVENSTTLPYISSTGSEYIVDYDAAAQGAGFVDDLIYSPLPADEIPITIAGNTTPGTYNGTITVRNECGFASSPQSFKVTVNPLPAATVSVDFTTICEEDAIVITFSESAHSPGTEFTVATTVTDNNGSNPVALNDVISSDHLDWTEGPLCLQVSDLILSH